MARLSGVDLPREKRLEIALTYIYGVGRTRAKQTLEATGLSPDREVPSMTVTTTALVPLQPAFSDAERLALAGFLAGYRGLTREADIRRKVEIGCYQGIRHRRGLPVHGQRTKTNARTRKGPKKTIAGKKKAGKK